MILVRLFIFLGGLFALGLIALLIGPYFIDWTDYRSQFQQQASRILGQKVVVNGDAELRILPFPSLTFNDLTVGESQSGQPMMTAKQFEVDIEISPFLSGEILIFDMRVVEPELTITLLADGTLDWALRSEKQLSGKTLVLEKITVTDGKITLIDLQNQRRERITNINATLAAPEISGPWDIDGTATLEERAIKYAINTGTANPDGHIRLRSRLSMDDLPLYLESEGDAKIIDNKPSYIGKFSIAKQSDKNVLNTEANLRLLLSLNIKGDFKANSERLEISAYRLASGKTSDPYVVEGKALIDTGANPEFSITAKGQQIDVAKLATKRNNDKTQADIRSGFDRLKEIAQEIPVPDIPGQINLSLPAVVAGQTTIRDIELRARPQATGWFFEQFKAKLPGRTNIEAKGSVTLGDDPSFEGSMLVASRQPSGFSSWLIGSVDPVIRQLGNAGFSANVLLNKNIQRLENLELILGSSVVNGKAERQNLPNKKPSITINLRGDEIDLDRMFAITKLANLDKTIDESGGLFNHDIAIQFDVKQMKFDRLSAEDVTTVGSWKSGDLNIENVTFGNFAGASGQLSGSLKSLIDKPSGNIEFNFTAETANEIFSLARDLSNRHPLVERLRKNQSYFSDVNLSGNLEIGDDQIPQLTVNGTINESDINLRTKGQVFGPLSTGTPVPPFTIKLKSKNTQSAKLLSQLGFEILPFDFEESAELDLEISRSNSENMDIVARVLSGSTDINIDGALKSDGNKDISQATGEFKLAIFSDDIEPLLLSIGQNPPGIGTGQPLELNAMMQTSGDLITLKDIDGNAEGNVFRGELVFDNSGRNLKVEGKLDLDELEFEWFYELALGIRIDTISDEPWNSSPFLPPYDFTPRAALTLSASKLFIPNSEVVKNFSSNVTIGPGDLVISNIAGEWFDGDLLGDLSISNPDGKAFTSLKGSLTGADLKRFSWIDGNQPTFNGDIEILGHVEGAGDSLTAVLQSLNGGGLYNINNINVSNFNPDILDRILAQVDNQDFEITPEAIAEMTSQFVSNSDYKIDNLSLPFTVTGGQQRLSSIKVEDALFEITGEARFDIPAKTMDAEIDILHDPQLELQTGATPELTYIFRGSIDAPSRSVDANAMSNFLSIRAYERERRRVELLQASILEKQSLRREISLVKDQQFKREEQALLRAEEDARIKAEQVALREAEEAVRFAEEEAKRLAEAESLAAEEDKLKAEQEAERIAAEKKATEQKALLDAKKRAEEKKTTERNEKRIADEKAKAAAQVKAAKDAAEKKTINWEISVERILNGDQNVLSRENITVLPLDAPTSE